MSKLKTDQKPVAWRYRPNGNYGWMFVELMPHDTINYVSEPLYTHPSRTLSDEEILDIYGEKCDSTVKKYVLAFARAILEKANER